MHPQIPPIYADSELKTVKTASFGLADSVRNAVIDRILFSR